MQFLRKRGYQLNLEYAASSTVHDVVQEMLTIYDSCMADAELARAAYGLAIGGLSIALAVSLRTAALLLEHALTVRTLKKETTCQVIPELESLRPSLSSKPMT